MFILPKFHNINILLLSSNNSNQPITTSGHSWEKGEENKKGTNTGREEVNLV